MRTAAEVCRDFVEYAEGRVAMGDRHGDAYKEILRDAKKVVDAAIASGELDRTLETGNLLDTSMTFCGHGIMLKIAPHSTCRREGALRERFIRRLKSCYPEQI